MKMTNKTDTMPVGDLYVFTGRLNKTEEKVLLHARRHNAEEIRRVLCGTIGWSGYYAAIPMALAGQLFAVYTPFYPAR